MPARSKLQPKTRPESESESESRPQYQAKKPLKTRSRIVVFVIFALLWVFACMTASQYIFYFTLFAFVGSDISQPGWNALYTFLTYGLALFLILFVPHRLFKQGKLTRETLGLTGLPKWADIGLAPIGFVIYTFLASVVVGLFSQFPFFDANETQNLSFSQPYFWYDKLSICFAICLVAPIVEEIVFRGWLYGKLRASIPGKASLPLSIFATSLLFAVLHGQWSVGLNVFCLSVVLCGLREVTGTIYSGILLHIIKNFIAFFLMYL